MVNCHASNKGLFGGMIIFSCTMISIILYVVFRNQVDDKSHSTPFTLVETNHDYSHNILTSTSIISHGQESISSTIPTESTVIHGPLTSRSKPSENIHFSIAILEIMDLCLLALSLFATIWSLIEIRKLNFRRSTTRKKQKRKEKHLSISFSFK